MKYSTFQDARKQILSSGSYIRMDFMFRDQDIFQKVLDSLKDESLRNYSEDEERFLFEITRNYFGRVKEYFSSLEIVAQELDPRSTLLQETRVTLHSKTHRMHEFTDDPVGVSASVRRELHFAPPKNMLVANANFGWIEGEPRKLIYWLGDKNIMGYGGKLELTDLRQNWEPEPLSAEEKVRVETQIQNFFGEYLK